MHERPLELRHEHGVTRFVVVETAGEIEGAVRDWVAGRSVHVVTSGAILALHGERALGALEAAAGEWRVHSVPDGEAAKSLEVGADLWQRLLASGARRDSRMLTFGGGSICDLGGFVASTFMRGISVSHLPTTLLAQVDAAIGGKSAINLPGAKNVVGTFHHPDRVVAAVDLLRTLPVRELSSGLVEVIKMAALLDLELLAAIERDLDELLAQGGSPLWTDLVARAQRAKVAVVARDAREAGERRVLNFGHTLGHAIEAELGYSGLAHGEAVAWGMRFALQLAVARGMDPGFGRRLEGLLDRLRPAPLPRLDVAALARRLKHDKKSGPGGVVWVLPTAPGQWEATPLPADRVVAELDSFMARHCPAC